MFFISRQTHGVIASSDPISRPTMSQGEKSETANLSPPRKTNFSANLPQKSRIKSSDMCLFVRAKIEWR